MIEKYKAKRLEKVKPATVNRELATLKNMFTMAIKWGYIKINPAKEVKLLKEPPGRLRYLKPEEAEVLLSSCADHIRPIVVTALNTGMRKGELQKLKWAYVDFKNQKITVINAKNNESRIIPINKTLYKELYALLEKANIEDFRFHDLRHTFGSYLVMQGVDLKTVQQIMGHKDIRMTMRYAHLSPEYVQKAVETLDSLWTLYGHQASKS
jgi:integrase